MHNTEDSNSQPLSGIFCALPLKRNRQVIFRETTALISIHEKIREIITFKTIFRETTMLKDSYDFYNFPETTLSISQKNLVITIFTIFRRTTVLI